MKKFFNDFGQFIKKGNVLDLAVAVIIGGAFGKIVASLVKDIIMPLISLLVGATGFENLKYVITPANVEQGIVESAIYYGTFIQNVIDFLIIALVVFIIIRFVSKASALAQAKKIEEEKKAQETVQAIEVPVVKQPSVEELLTDIKNLLEKKMSS